MEDDVSITMSQPTTLSHAAATFDAQPFVVSHSTDGGWGDKKDFAPRGLRAFFEYRDLAVGGATGGKWGAHLIRKVRQRGR